MKIAIAPEYLLDTNVILESFWGREPVAALVKGWIKKGEIAISAVSVAEILSKASKEEKEKLNLLISRFGVLPIDEVIAEIAGDYRLQFARKKKRVYLLDCLIAATAKLYNLKLVTKNIKDYSMKDIVVIRPTRYSSSKT
ncbi:type II toxin-antitoxin system VapC family toxin [Candidatus Shapirobacteria bacterium]|nr:type II toxin-antitoxin system VapC family toxin [Candidatus Shapirobacteria bacterium]